MINIEKAYLAFEKYISHYDQSIPSIHLKVVHTYEVIKVNEYLCEKMNVSEEDKNLASLIALLHDIGRFEQWMIYQSYADFKTIDHALFSSQLLFDKGYIREFIEDESYDEIIRNAIEQHNKYKIDEEFDERTMFFIHLIRDADKLDHFRVKDEEKIETLLFTSVEKVNQSLISPAVYEQMYNQQSIYAPVRKTYIDFWLSYTAFIFDLYFDCSIEYIRENHWVERSFDKLSPVDINTKKQYQILRQRTLEFVGKELYES